MRGLTLWQPWASLVAIGAKSYETRSWSTEYRGSLAIHAAKRQPELPPDVTAGKHMMAALQEADVVWASLPRGAFVAVCRLVDCFPVEDIWPELQELGNEQYFGDYSSGRFGWVLDDIRLLDPPVPARGAQSLWYVAPEIVKELRKLTYP